MKPAFLIISLLFSFHTFSQSKKDTTTTYYDWNWKKIETGIPAYMGIVWKEADKWHSQDYYYPELKLQMDGMYADKDLKIKDGLFTWFYRNGMMEDSCFYKQNRQEGEQATWDTSGNQTSIRKWAHDLPVDTAIWWNKDGGVTAVQITDSSGNGFYQSYLDDGKTIRTKGRLMTGKRSGKWTFKDSKGIPGVDAVYLADSVISTVCYNEQGEVETGKTDCRIEKPAAFNGGPDGWRRYLERRLVYPEQAFKNNIQGVIRVQFIIEKDGSVSDVKVLGSPNELLAAEAMRLIKQSPKWEPAVQYNRRVIYRHIQSITFALQ